MALNTVWFPDCQSYGMEMDRLSPGRKPKTGISYNRAMAIAAAKVALESAIKVKRRAKPMTQ